MSTKELLADPVVAKTVAAATTAAGAITALDMIQVYLGIIAVIMGIVLSCVTLRSQWLTIQKTKLETKLLNEKAARKDRKEKIKGLKSDAKTQPKGPR